MGAGVFAGAVEVSGSAGGTGVDEPGMAGSVITTVAGAVSSVGAGVVSTGVGVGAGVVAGAGADGAGCSGSAAYRKRRGGAPVAIWYVVASVCCSTSLIEYERVCAWPPVDANASSSPRRRPSLFPCVSAGDSGGSR